MAGAPARPCETGERDTEKPELKARVESIAQLFRFGHQADTTVLFPSFFIDAKIAAAVTSSVPAGSPAHNNNVCPTHTQTRTYILIASNRDGWRGVW